MKKRKAPSLPEVEAQGSEPSEEGHESLLVNRQGRQRGVPFCHLGRGPGERLHPHREYKLIKESAGAPSFRVMASGYTSQNSDYRNDLGAARLEKQPNITYISDDLGADPDASKSTHDEPTLSVSQHGCEVFPNVRIPVIANSCPNDGEQVTG